MAHSHGHTGAKEVSDRRIAGTVALNVLLTVGAIIGGIVSGSISLIADALHNLNDAMALLIALASLGVLFGGVAILLFDVNWVDPLLSLVIVGYIFWQVYGMFPEMVRVLMEGTPEDFDVSQVVREIQQVEGIRNAHHLHVWQLDEHHTALEAHLVISRSDAERMDEIKQAAKRRLEDTFGIAHSTLERDIVKSCVRPDQAAILSGWTPSM